MWPDLSFSTPADLITATLVVVGYGGLVVALVPPLFAYFGLTRLWFTVREADEIRSDGSEPEYEALVNQLLVMGYRPAGEVVERMLFVAHEWSHTCRVRKWVAPDNVVFAAVYQHNPGGVWRAAFESLLDGGCLVQTVVPGAGLVHLLADVVRTEFGSRDLRAAEGRHRRNLGLVATASGQRPTEPTLTELARVDEATSRCAVSGGKDAGVFNLLFAWLLVPAAIIGAVVVTLVALCGSPPDPLAVQVGFGLAGGVGCYFWCVLFVFPEAAVKCERELLPFIRAFPPIDLEPLLPNVFPPAGADQGR